MFADVDVRLPRSVQEVAEVIGRERALYLVGKLPRSAAKYRNGERVWLYVPKRLKPDHPLVKILGWQDASKIVKEFGGIILELSSCNRIYLDFRNRSIRRMAAMGMLPVDIAQQMNLTTRHIQDILHESMPEEINSLRKKNGRSQTTFGSSHAKIKQSA